MPYIGHTTYKAICSIHRVQFDIQSAFVPQIGLGSYTPGQEVDRGGERGGGNIIHRGLSHYNTHSYLTFGFHPPMSVALLELKVEWDFTEVVFWFSWIWICSCWNEISHLTRSVSWLPLKSYFESSISSKDESGTFDSLIQLTHGEKVDPGGNIYIVCTIYKPSPQYSTRLKIFNNSHWLCKSMIIPDVNTVWITICVLADISFHFV